jgi:hypothetical protein
MLGSLLMGAPFVRPRVSDLMLLLYDRPLHPELFDVVASRTVKSAGFTLTARLTRTGHVLGCTTGDVHLEELTTTPDVELPGSGRRLGHRFEPFWGGRTRIGKLGYQVSTQLEFLTPEQFVHVHEELALEGMRKGLLFHYPSGNRIGLSPMGVIVATGLPRGINVATFHTFPDEYAVVRSQTLIEWG